ncbi:MAG TPA: alpha/beta fold hydrolase [Thermoanaerobaculia bacterium]|nr:alpha/beta fold hydrolase [Thermoanaerobaculia bacterium]
MIWCLHGFLGKGSDWKFLADELSRAGLETSAPDLLAESFEPVSMSEWATGFVEQIAQIPDTSRVLVGYSMGGRLAIHALLAAPELFSRAVIVSGGVGIEGDLARAERIAADERWAERFEHEAWSEVIEAWNDQEVFRTSGTREHSSRADGGETLTRRSTRHPLPRGEGGTVRGEGGRVRGEGEFSREALGVALRCWSPAAHEPLHSRLPSIRSTLLWVAGELDGQYVDVGRRAVRQIPNARLKTIEGAGHRVMFDQPERFAEVVREFLTAE